MAQLALRWETASRYYSVYVHHDLWGDVVMTRDWGGKGTRLGNLHTDHLSPEAIELALQEIAKRRQAHKYQPANFDTAQYLQQLAEKPPCESSSL